MGCVYHRDIDKNLHCSLANVKNWAFVMSEHLCAFFRIDMILGRHVPTNADVESPLKVWFLCAVLFGNEG